jgi:hypothetical protein
MKKILIAALIMLTFLSTATVTQASEGFEMDRCARLGLRFSRIEARYDELQAMEILYRNLMTYDYDQCVEDMEDLEHYEDLYNSLGPSYYAECKESNEIFRSILLVQIHECEETEALDIPILDGVIRL